MGDFGHPIQWNIQDWLHRVFNDLPWIHFFTMEFTDDIEPHLRRGDFSQISWTTKEIPGFCQRNWDKLLGMDGINFRHT
jgi:hypothetical protein